MKYQIRKENGMSLVNDAGTLILQMTNDELNEVIDMIKLKRGQLSAAAVRNFSEMDEVTFEHKGRIVEGVVAKVNQKYIHVETISDGKWKVPAAYLTRMGG